MKKEIFAFLLKVAAWILFRVADVLEMVIRALIFIKKLKLPKLNILVLIPVVLLGVILGSVMTPEKIKTETKYVTVLDTIHDTIYSVKKQVVYKNRKIVKIVPVEKRRLRSYKDKVVYNYKVSEKGRELIKQHEGCSLDAYGDSWGFSIGYGHFMGKSKTYKHISKWKAEQLFNQDIKIVESGINKLMNEKKLNTRGYKFSQDFIDGLADLMYNCGQGNIEKSSIYKDLCNKVRWYDPELVDQDIRFLASKVKKFNITCGAHVERREEEATLMASND